ncbi:MAG: hypothetical protein ACF8XB_23355 [Planctomycetota bacterium JB042]
MISPLSLAPLLPATLLAGNTFTVDDDGPADFPSILEAVASGAVTDGDLLLVASGSYAGFHLDKELTLCGPASGPRPTVDGKVRVSAAAAELVRLQIAGLHLDTMAERATIEDCVVLGSTSQEIGMLVQYSSLVMVSRTTVSGLSPAADDGGLGILAVGSSLVLAGSTVNGGDGGAGSHDGGTAVRAIQSDLLFAGGGAIGGAAGTGGGNAGHGMHLVHSVARARGSMFDVVLPGPPGAGNQGQSFLLQDSSTLVLGPVLSSGIAQTGAPSAVVLPPVPEPFLRNAGPNGLGTGGSLDLFGPPAALAFLVIAEEEKRTPVPELDGDLWLDADAIFFLGFLLTNGPMFPASCPYAIPAAPILTGRSFRCQAMFPGVPGGLDPTLASVSNAVDVIVRP